MSASEALEAGRAFAEEQMIDTGSLRAKDVRGPLDPVTGQYQNTPGALKYSGEAKGQATDTIGNARDAAERSVMVTRSELHLPITAPLAIVDDVWTWDVGVMDPLLAGRRFRIAGLGENKSYSTVRRYTVEEVQS